VLPIGNQRNEALYVFWQELAGTPPTNCTVVTGGVRLSSLGAYTSPAPVVYQVQTYCSWLLARQLWSSKEGSAIGSNLPLLPMLWAQQRQQGGKVEKWEKQRRDSVGTVNRVNKLLY
jgi:hypothetical protein